MGVGNALMRRAAFLDRDGVINAATVKDGRPYPPATLEDLRVLPGVERAVRLLRDAGYLIIVVTNQPDVARGVTDRSAIDSMHAQLRMALSLDAVYVCWHDDADQCLCRKPRPGLLLNAAVDHNVNLARSFMIGDRWRDIAAGQNAGCRTIWIKRDYQERAPTAPIDFVTDGLPNAVHWILSTAEIGK